MITESNTGFVVAYRYKYQLCTTMVMDEFGEGRVVQQSLFEANGDWHMDKVLEHLERANPDSLKMVRVIIIDKDFIEIRVLRSHFKETQISICLFHVIKYLKTMSRKPEFGKVAEQDHSSIDHIVHNMVYVATEDIYEQGRHDLRVLCDRIGLSGLCQYMEVNWHSCIDMWVMYRQRRSPISRTTQTIDWRTYSVNLKRVSMVPAAWQAAFRN